MKRQVLVTGGAGFIGSEVVRQLLAAGDRVTIFDNFSFGRRGQVPKSVRVIKGDLRLPASIRPAIDRKYDAVYHLAALHFIPYCNEHPGEAAEVNVAGTQNLLTALQQRPPKSLFFASTAAVYDSSSRMHREEDAPAPLDIYGVTKLAGEHLVRAFHEASGVPSAMGRLFNAYGPGETNPHLIPHLLSQLRHKGRVIELGNLHPYRDYIHIRDIAGAILHVTQRTHTISLTNIASGEEYSVRQVVQHLEKILDRKLRIQSRAGLRRRVERIHLRADLSRLKKGMGFKPKVRFREGLAALLSSEGIQ